MIRLGVLLGHDYYRQFLYILAFLPPLLVFPIQKKLYKTEKQKIKPIYWTILFVTFASFFIYRNTIPGARFFDGFYYYKMFVENYLFHSIVLSTLLSLCKWDWKIHGIVKNNKEYRTGNLINIFSCFNQRVYMHLVIFLFWLVLTGTIYIQKYFGDVAPDQLMFHLTVHLVGDEAGRYFKKFIITCFFIPLLGTWLLMKLIRIMPDYMIIPIPRFEIKIPIFPKALPFIALIYAVYIFLTQTSLKEFIDFKDDTFIEEHYVDPVVTQITWPKKKKNMVFLCLESMESSFTSKEYGGFYDKNYIPNLTQIALDPKNVHFSNTGKMGGGAYTNLAYWSIAGAFAMWSGLPFKWGDHENRRGFIPGAYTLLDMFIEQGYQQYLVFGHKDGFGVGPFYRRHANVKMFDEVEIKKQLPKYENMNTEWGVNDYVVFEMSRNILDNLTNSEKPFNIIINTIDTHFEEGIICELCRHDNEDRYFDTFECADRQVRGFLDYLKTKPFYNDTLIFIVGDHHTMCTRIKGAMIGYDRGIYNALINADAKPVNGSTRHRKFDTFDWFPTLVAALGAKIDGDRLALGTNLFSGKKTLTEEIGSQEEVNKHMGKSSVFFNREILHFDPEGIFIEARAKWEKKPSVLSTK